VRWATEGDPDAGGGENLMLVNSKGRLQNLCDPLRDSNCVTYSINLLDQDGELVPAESRGAVPKTQASL
jgi:hypothetical protein